MIQSAKASGERSVVVGRDVINSIINTGDHNRFFIGDYVRLKDAYIEPWPVFERVNLDRFVGREWLLAEVDAFLRDHDRGYFVLEAEAGLGKTTFLAWLVKQRGYVHHFVELARGLEGVGAGLKNLGAQVVLAYHLEAWEADGVLPGAAARPDYLARLLKLAATQRQDDEKVVLVVDALDEAGTPTGENVLGLPQVLPEGVYVIASQRPVAVALQVDAASTARRVFRLAAGSDENQADMRRYLEGAAMWSGIGAALRASGYSPEQFVETLMVKCRGVWIYLHYVIHEIERGERTPLDLDGLPDGMTQYYVRYWRRWRDADEIAWYESYLPLLATLAAAQEAVSARRLREWTGVTLALPQFERLLNERWRPFLALSEAEEGTCYRYYHATLTEFFGGQIEKTLLNEADATMSDELTQATQAAHGRLADRYLEAWGGMDDALPGLRDNEKRDFHDGYGLRHLAAHLEGADRVNDLHGLLRLERAIQGDKDIPLRKGVGGIWQAFLWGARHQNVWYQAHEDASDMEHFRYDVTRAWRLVEALGSLSASDNGGPKHSATSSPRPSVEKDRTSMVGLQCRYALIVASLNSMAGHVPTALLGQMVARGVWSSAQGLMYARSAPQPIQRSRSLVELSARFPETERDAICREALKAIETITDPRTRAAMLAEIVPLLPPPLVPRNQYSAWSILEVLDDLEANGHLLFAMLPILSEHERTRVAENVLKLVETGIEDENKRQLILEVLAPYLPEPLLRQALVIAQRLTGGFARGAGLAALVPYLSESLLTDALGIVRTHSDDWFTDLPTGYRSLLLWQIAQRLNETDQPALIQEALATARTIQDDSGRVSSLMRIAPLLQDARQAEVLSEALTVARSIESAEHRAHALLEVAEGLSEESRHHVVREALAAAKATRDESFRTSVMARYLPTSQLPEVEKIAKSIPDKKERSLALTELVPYLAEDRRPTVMQKALDSARSISRSHWESIACELAPYLTLPLLQQSIRFAVELHDGYDRAIALAVLASRASGWRPRQIDDLFRSAFKATMKINHEAERATAFVALCSNMPDSQFNEALLVAQTFREEMYIDFVWTELMPRLPQSLVPQALASARKMYSHLESSYGARWALKAVMGCLPRELTGEALALIQTLQDRYGRTDDLAQADLLVALVPSLSDALCDKALDMVGQQGGDYGRAAVIIAISQRLTEPLLEKALSVAQTIQYPSRRNAAELALTRLPSVITTDFVWSLQERIIESSRFGEFDFMMDWAFKAITQRLIESGQRELLPIALFAASLIRHAWSRFQALMTLVPHLSEPERGETLLKALNTAKELPDYTLVLEDLVPHLSEIDRNEQLENALDSARSMEETEVRARALMNLAPLLASLPLDVLERFWRETLPILATRTRRDLLSDFRSLEPMIVALGGPVGAGELCQAIVDTGEWWP